MGSEMCIRDSVFENGKVGPNGPISRSHFGQISRTRAKGAVGVHSRRWVLSNVADISIVNNHLQRHPAREEIIGLIVSRSSNSM